MLTLIESVVKLVISLSFGAGAGMLAAGLMMYFADPEAVTSVRTCRMGIVLTSVGTGCLFGSFAAAVLFLGFRRRRLFPELERDTSHESIWVDDRSDKIPF
jgi:hypothetical protein